MTWPGMRARVCGVGLIAPGISGWEEGAAILGGQRPWVPAPLTIPDAGFLPAAERRRTGKAIRLALGCGHQAIAASGIDAADAASVFASADVDAENTHQICVALNAADPSLSPTRFHNSVQNAVSGYWTILTGSRAPTTMVMGGDEILALGLLEAMTQVVLAAQPVLLVVFDVAMPPPLFATHPIEGGGALALVLRADDEPGARMAVRLVRRADGAQVDSQHDAPRAVQWTTSDARDAGPPADIPDGLAPLRRVHPLGAALPMLARLAGWGRPGTGAAESARREISPPGRFTFSYDRYHSLEVTIVEARADADGS